MDVDQLMHRSTFVSGSGRKFAVKGSFFYKSSYNLGFGSTCKEFKMLELCLCEKFCNGRRPLAENSGTEGEKEIELPSCSR
jgi:hypothetical protein